MSHVSATTHHRHARSYHAPSVSRVTVSYRSRRHVECHYNTITAIAATTSLQPEYAKPLYQRSRLLLRHFISHLLMPHYICRHTPLYDGRHTTDNVPSAISPDVILAATGIVIGAKHHHAITSLLSRQYAASHSRCHVTHSAASQYEWY